MSVFRKQTLCGIKLINLDMEESEKLSTVIYLGHPASINQSGEGMSQTLFSFLQGAGLSQRHLGRSYRGLCADGGILNVNLSDHLLQMFCGTDSTPRSMRSKVIWVWDGAHIIELILKHALDQYPVIKDAKEKLASLTKFFRDSTVYEILRKVGLDSSQRLYTPKLVREMKFVAHDSTIAHDFIRNRVLYTRALRVIVNTHTNKDLVEEARGFIVQLTDEIWLLDVFLQVAVTRVLKRFSTQFQVSLFSTFTFFKFLGSFKYYRITFRPIFKPL